MRVKKEKKKERKSEKKKEKKKKGMPDIKSSQIVLITTEYMNIYLYMRRIGAILTEHWITKLYNFTLYYLQTTPVLNSDIDAAIYVLVSFAFLWILFFLF